MGAMTAKETGSGLALTCSERMTVTELGSGHGLTHGLTLAKKVDKIFIVL
jgi:hypothetical protein